VAIARALSFNPDLLLLDEPLSALDRKLREEMQLEFRRIQQELGVTTINVTHDQREALVMSDQIIVMSDGVIQQTGDPVNLYRDPSNRFVAHFIGLTSLMSGRVVEARGADAVVAIGGLTLRGRAAETELTQGAPVDCAIRAEQVRILKVGQEPGDLDNVVPGEVEQRIFEGDRMVYQVRCPAMQDAVLFAYDHDPTHHNIYRKKEKINVCWNRSDLFVYRTR
jgi:putative spermidine/putrescine transport system ATP-binding protein